MPSKKGKSKKKKLLVKTNKEKEKLDNILDEELDNINDIKEQMNKLMELKKEIIDKNIVIDKDDSTDSYEKEQNTNNNLSSEKNNEMKNIDVSEENDNLDDLLLSNDELKSNVDKFGVSNDDTKSMNSTNSVEVTVSNNNTDSKNLEEVTVSKNDIDSKNSEEVLVSNEENKDKNIDELLLNNEDIDNVKKNKFNECMREIKDMSSFNYINIILFLSIPVFYYIGISKLFLILLAYNFFITPSKRRYYLFSLYLYYHLFGFIALSNSVIIFGSYYLLNNSTFIIMSNNYLENNMSDIKKFFNKRKEKILNKLNKIKLFLKIKNVINDIIYLLDKYYILYMLNYINKILGYVINYMKNGIYRVIGDFSSSSLYFIKKFSFFKENDFLKKNNIKNKNDKNNKKKNDNYFIDEFDNLDDLLMNDDEVIKNFKNNNMGQQMDMLLGMMSQANTLMKQVGNLNQNNLRRRNNINSINI